MAVRKEKPVVSETQTDVKVESTPSEIEILKQQLKESQDQSKALQEQMQEQMRLMQSLMSNQSKPSEKNELTRRVKIIHLQQPSADLTTHISLSKLKIDFRHFGEERYVNFDDFQELVGKYDIYFHKNIIALSSEDEDLVERYKLTKVEDVALKPYHVQKITEISCEELEELYKKVSENHKLLITRTWAYGFYELQEPAYMDRRKVEMLNDLSGGAMENILSELDAQRRKK